MSNPGFLAHTDNTVLAASISQSSQSSVYPAVNVQTLPISKPWRTTGVSSEYIELDLGSNKNVTLIALINHNLTSGATVTVKAGLSPGPTTVIATMTYRKYDMFVVGGVTTARYWRFTFADSGNTNGFLSVGYIMLGNYTNAPTFAYGFPFSDLQTNLSLATEFNVAHNAALAYQVQFGYTWNNLSDADMNVLRDLSLEVQKNVYPFFWVPDVAVNDGYLMRFGNDFVRTMDFWRTAQATLIEDSRGAAVSS